MKYFSEELNKVFDTQEELLEAEQAEVNKKLEEEAAKEQRKIDAKEVEDAFKAADEAYKLANEKLAEFKNKYKSYHLTITGKSNLPSPTSLFDLFFNDFWF